MRVPMEQINNRRQMIMNLLDSSEHLTVSKVAEKLGIPVSSARRQIRQMEMEGTVIRTSRGIMPSGRDVEEYLAVKYQLHRAEKRAIALAAAKQIVEGDIILIGGGSTTYELAKLLRQAKNIHVITTSVPIAYELYSHPNIEVEMVGGLINRQNGVATSHHAVNHLSSIHVRKAFLGADSISLEHGITTPSYFEAEIEKVVIQNSDKVFILTDHSKFNKISLTPLAKLQEIYAIITDNSSDEAYLRQIEAKGPKIIRT